MFSAMDRRGIEIATSFIVILIISIVTFGLASAITYKIFCSSNDKITDLDKQTEERVEKLLNSGAAVNIPDAAKSAKSAASFCGGSNVASAAFALGIRNDFPDDQDFTISCEHKGVEHADGSVTAATDTCADWGVQYDTSSFIIGGKAKVTKRLVFNVPPGTEEGKHVFTFRVSNAGTFYGAKTLYLTVV